MSVKKVLALGATGAIGEYLVPNLAALGYQVDVVALDEKEWGLPNVRHMARPIRNEKDLEALTANHYDAIVDCLYYPTSRLVNHLPWIVRETGHYVFLSSYRVYDGKEIPVTESSPRLLDTGDDPLLRNSDDYSIFKCRAENVLWALPEKNWTIVRPAITYAYLRYQLVTWEAANTVGRAFAGKKVVLPDVARKVQATMSWSGDVGKMLARLLFKEEALGENFNVTTAEHHPWEEVAAMYKDICGLEAVWIDKEPFLDIMASQFDRYTVKWQLECDRLFNRIMDNTKILKVTGMSQADLTPLHQGLEREIRRCPKDHVFPVNQAMDTYLREHGLG